jgi:hypothetical protein
MSKNTSAVKQIGCVQHDCAACRKHAKNPDREFYRGVIAALGALRGMCGATSTEYHEVAKTFDLEALVSACERGDAEWSGLRDYLSHCKNAMEAA